MRRSAATFQKTSRAEHESARTNGAHVACSRSLRAEKVEHLGILQQRVDASTSWHTQNIESRAFGEGHGRSEHESRRRGDCRAILPDEMHVCARNGGKDLVRTGEVE